MTKYIIKKSHNDQYYWVLDAPNHECIMRSSETYVSKQGCKESIEISKKCLTEKHFKKSLAENDEYYFLQIADNYEEIGISELYSSVQNRDKGIESVKRNAPAASIDDLT